MSILQLEHKYIINFGKLSHQFSFKFGYLYRYPN